MNESQSESESESESEDRESPPLITIAPWHRRAAARALSELLLPIPRGNLSEGEGKKSRSFLLT
jgi:hypothetical protein